ncbi:hypothetical protein [Burkholderia ubonensis]|uniref:hypothetical protein n=1 Tax=Burkholderia ubonensis TaxID=101571 RepID=UPI0012F7ADCD|nr:hypothetical protein [Burkholderia ubonensis]
MPETDCIPVQLSGPAERNTDAQFLAIERADPKIDEPRWFRVGDTHGPVTVSEHVGIQFEADPQIQCVLPEQRQPAPDLQPEQIISVRVVWTGAVDRMHETPWDHG